MYRRLNITIECRYYAPSELGFTDCYRFNRDGMAPARLLERTGKRFSTPPTSELQVSGYYA